MPIEQEPNNNSASANALTLGTSMTGQLATSTDVDWYRFTTTSAGTLSIVLDVPTSSTLDYFRVGLYDATSGALMNSYLTGSDKTFQTAVPGAGSYFLAIDVPSYNYSGSSYSVTANLVAGSVAGFESEPNNASTTADALTLGTSMTGQLATSTDVDWYRFTTTSAGTLSIVLDVPTSSTLDYFRVGLYDATSGALMNSYLTGSDKTFQTAVPGAGSYFLAIDVPSYNYSGSSYSVTANLVAGSVAGFESEPNNASTTADALTLGTSMTGQLATSTDVDWYRFTTTSAGTLSIVLDVPTSSTLDYFRVGLYDATSGALMNSYLTGSDKTFQTAVPGAGSYFLAIDVPSYNYSGSSYSVTANLVAGSVAGFESEPNNASTTADALTLGTSMTGQLATSTDVDWYRFTTTSAGTLSIVLDVPTSSTLDYFRVGLYDATSGALMNSYLTGSDKTFQTAVPGAGSYFLAIDVPSYNYSGSSYSVTANLVAGSVAGFESEPNNASTTADALTLGTSMTGQLATSTDVDWYRFTTTSAGTLSIVLDVPTSSTLDYFRVGLYDATSGALMNSYLTGSDKTFQTAVPGAGSYFLAIDVPSYNYSGSSYSVTANLVAGSVAGFESEPNNASTTADALTLGTSMTGQLATSTDVDWYRFTTTSAGTLSIVLDVPTSSTLDYFRVGLYDATSGALMNSYLTGSDKTFQTAVPGAGSYFLAIDVPSYNYSGSSYSVTANLVAGSVAGFESEPNNASTTADALTLGTDDWALLSTDRLVSIYSGTSMTSMGN
jgi:hypothetical protein